MSLTELEQTIVELEEEMLAAAEELRFEYAARAARRDPRPAPRAQRRAGQRGAGLSATRPARSPPALSRHLRPS